MKRYERRNERRKEGGIRMCRGRHIGERSKEDDVCMCICIYCDYRMIESYTRQETNEVP